jgi:histidine triad (HIT) family protein
MTTPCEPVDHPAPPPDLPGSGAGDEDPQAPDVGKPKDCVFCRIAAGEEPAAVVYEDSELLACLHVAPVVPGHALLMTKSHFPAIGAAPPEIQGRLMATANDLATLIARAMNADGFNLLAAAGTCAGQVVRHAHLDIIPRSPLDGLPLPPLGGMAPDPRRIAELQARICRRLDDET